jgi:cytochrome c biogenesis protein CcmG/thiol:disulfide interchange protein DsbE
MMRFIPLIVFLLLALFMGVALLSGGAPQPPSAMVGRAVPAAALDGIAPETLNKGTAVVNFFASWCAPCAQEQPVLARLAAAHPAVTVVGIAYKDTPDAIDAWLADHGNPFAAIAHDASGAAAIDWGVYGVPETYVVIDGIIRHRHVGPLEDDTVARDFVPLLEEGKTP